MKVTDYNLIAETAASIIDDGEYTITDLIGRERAIFCLMAIYNVNDWCKGYGQDFVVPRVWNENEGERTISIIAFENGVSVIVDSHSSRYQDRFPMCGYEDLHDDLYQITIDIQAALDRIDANF